MLAVSTSSTNWRSMFFVRQCGENVGCGSMASVLRCPPYVRLADDFGNAGLLFSERALEREYSLIVSSRADFSKARIPFDGRGARHITQ